MSTALRIAAVTQVLKDLLNDGLINNDVSGITQNNITVSSLPPDRILNDNTPESSQLNIFMYQAAINSSLRNVGYPSFNSGGDRISNPPLTLDLHYLLSAYGASELHTEILLGYGMQFLHETPVLPRELIKEALGSVQVNDPESKLPDYMRFLSQSFLADQVEQIKITPENLSTEDISKLWAAFGAKYRPTAAYMVTVVLIESEKSVKSGLPVKGRNVYVQPFKKPVIEKIFSQSALNQPVLENQKILSGYRLVLRGVDLYQEKTEVYIDGDYLDPVASDQVTENNEISFQLPDSLSAGKHEVSINHPVLMGTPEVPHKGTASNALLFGISPSVQGSPTVTNRTVNSDGTVNAVVEVKVTPKIEPEQKVRIILNELTIGENPKAYSFSLDPDYFGTPPHPVNDIRFQVKNIKTADYLVRIYVDGEESPLLSDAGNKYISPSVTI